MTAYPLASSTWDEDELRAIQEVLDSGRFTMGERVQRFEWAFAAFVGSRHCVMVNSGSSANLLAVAAPFFRKRDPLRAGDLVVAPAVSWATTYTPLQQYGLRVRFVDIDPGTLNYDMEALEKALDGPVRALVAVNLLGNPTDFRRIKRLLADRDVYILEDCCESMGACLDGRQTGTFGTMGTFSTFFSHHMSTMEGGLLVTDDEELYHIALALRAHGWTRNLPADNLVWPDLNPDKFYESFHFVLPGYNLRPLELSGAIGEAQLGKLPAFIEARRANASHFSELFEGHPHLAIQQELGQSSWFGFSLTLKDDSPWTRDDVVARLTAAGVDCRPVVAGNFTRNPVIRWFDHEIHGRLTNADRLHDRGFFVGNHHYALDGQLETLRSLLS